MCAQPMQRAPPPHHHHSATHGGNVVHVMCVACLQLGGKALNPAHAPMSFHHPLPARACTHPCRRVHEINPAAAAASGRCVQLHTREGIYLATAATSAGWVWCCRARPGSNSIAVGCQDGSVAVLQLTFSIVHGLYQARYAYRDQLTDVVVQHLSSERKVRIKCR